MSRLIYMLAAVLLCAPLFSFTIGKGAVTNGGSTVGNSVCRINGSAGQAITGVIASPSTQVCSGFWYQENPQSSSINEPAELTYQLQQNYPNPFNPATTIAFTLPQDGPVSIRVYDILGREVAELINTLLPRGSHQVSFKADQLATGQYFYRIHAGSFSQVKKMILIK